LGKEVLWHLFWYGFNCDKVLITAVTTFTAQGKLMANASIERLKELVDPMSLLTALGFSVYYDNQDEIRAPCVLHGGDNKTAFCFRKAVRRFYCYSRGCEVDSSGEINNDIVSLVMKVNRCSFIEAVRFLGQLSGIDVGFGEVCEEDERYAKKRKDTSKFIEGITASSTLEEIDESVVKSYVSNGCSYFINKGIQRHVLDFFEVGTMHDEFGIERATIPIRDDYGRLVSISGRRTDGNEEPRYKLLKNFKKRKVLYGLNAALEYRDAYGGNIILVEGFKALWHVVSCGFPNVAAVMGRVITQDQINLLVKYGFSCAFLLLDGDEKGREGMSRSKELLKGKIDSKFIYLQDNKSPDDLSLVDLFDLISLFF